MAADHAGSRPDRRELATIASVTIAFVAATSWLVQVPMILLHDEAVFALQAESWFAGGSGVGVGAHRAPLLSILGWPAFPVGRPEWALRAVGIASGVVALLAVWQLGRRTGGRTVGLVAATCFAFLPPVVDAASLYMSDLPAAAALVLVVVGLHHDLVVRHHAGRPVGPGLAVAAVATAASLYLRYGSALPVVLIWGTAVVLWWPRFAARPRRALAPIALLGVLLTPMAARGVVEFGVPWGRILYTTQAGRAETPAVQTLLGLLPGGVALAGAVFVAGLLGAVVWVWTFLAGRSGDELRTRVLIVVPAAGTAAVLGFVAYLHPRFLFLPLALLGVAVAMQLVGAWRGVLERRSLSPRTGTPLVVAVLVVYAVASTVAMWVWRDARAAENVVLERAASAIDAEAEPPCTVLTSHNPAISWYTACEGQPFTSRLDGEGDRLLLLIDGGKHQPTGAALDRLMACVEGEPVARIPPGPGRLGEATIHRIDDRTGCP